MPLRYLALIVTLCLAGCQDGGSGPSAGDGTGSGTGTKYTIAVIPKGTTHEFWKSVHAGAANAARELGNVTIRWKGPLQENDRAGQIGVVQDFITKQVDGICLAPLDSQALVEYVAEAADENIPVVIFDSGLDDESRIVTYVATDNFRGGVLAARRMGEVLNGEGDVILLRYSPGSESTTQREEGFLETLANEFPKINVLTSSEYSDVTPEAALDKATQLLEKYKGEVDGIFSVCEPNAQGTFGALQETEQTGEVCFIAFDPNSDLINGLEQNTVSGIVLQDPVKMGYEAVMAMYRHLEGEPVDKRINTGEYVATPENMNEPQMSKLLRPEQFEE